MSTLLVAAKEGDASKCLTALASGALSGLNARCENGRTSLHYAAMHSLDKVCAVLLQRKDFSDLSVNAVDTFAGHTALHGAAVAASSKCCRIIATHCRFNKVSARDAKGMTAEDLALFFAERRGPTDGSVHAAAARTIADARVAQSARQTKTKSRDPSRYEVIPASYLY